MNNFSFLVRRLNGIRFIVYKIKIKVKLPNFESRFYG